MMAESSPDSQLRQSPLKRLHLSTFIERVFKGHRAERSGETRNRILFEPPRFAFQLSNLDPVCVPANLDPRFVADEIEEDDHPSLPSCSQILLDEKRGSDDDDDYSSIVVTGHLIQEEEILEEAAADKQQQMPLLQCAPSSSEMNPAACGILINVERLAALHYLSKIGAHASRCSSRGCRYAWTIRLHGELPYDSGNKVTQVFASKFSHNHPRVGLLQIEGSVSGRIFGPGSGTGILCDSISRLDDSTNAAAVSLEREWVVSWSKIRVWNLLMTLFLWDEIHVRCIMLISHLPYHHIPLTVSSYSILRIIISHALYHHITCSVSSYLILCIVISHALYHHISYSVSSYPILRIIISHTPNQYIPYSVSSYPIHRIIIILSR